MRVLILGASGFLGALTYTRLQATLPGRVMGTYGERKLFTELHHIDLSSTESVRNTVEDLRPDVVVWCAKQRGPHMVERVIHEVGLNALIASAHPRMRLVYVSTDGLLPGVRGPYSESAAVVPIDADTSIAYYTNAKIYAEQTILSALENFCIVRVGPIYGRTISGDWDSRIAALLDQFQRQVPCVRPINLYRTFIHVDDLSKTLCELVTKDLRGILHVGPSVTESYYTFARAVAHSFGYSEHLVQPSVITCDEALERDVRLDTTMDTRRACANLNVLFGAVPDVLSNGLKQM